MFELDIDMLKEQGIQLFDTAKKTAQDIADKGKNQLELLNQQGTAPVGCPGLQPA